MSRREPPPIAVWMLEHLMPTNYDEALAGDLLESFCAGRSSAWYCRQVLAALVIRWVESIFRQRTVLVFAAAWAAISPAWWLLITWLYHSANLTGPVWRLPWPWSTVCMSALSLAEGILFIWIGVSICALILLTIFGSLKHWRIGRAFTLSIASYVFASVCESAIGLIAAPYLTKHGVDWRTLTLSGVITNFGVWAILMRIPFLIGTACALWGAVSDDRSSMKIVE